MSINVTMSKKKLEIDPISVEVWGRGQSIDLRAVIRPHVLTASLRLRVRVHADRSYSEQGWATVEHWSGDAWREVHARAGERLESAQTKHAEETSAALFESDVFELLRVALVVLGIPPCEFDMTWLVKS